jgi:hypothetical protein
MESQFHHPLELRAAFAAPARCPFHDGPATLDGLLAELGPDESDALDAALDLRSAVAAGQDAAACVALALRLRHALDGAHYLAFYRVRQWLQRVIAVQVRAWRGAEWMTVRLPLNSARLGEIQNACVAEWSRQHPDVPADLAQVRFVFLTRERAVARDVSLVSLA